MGPERFPFYFLLSLLDSRLWLPAKVESSEAQLNFFSPPSPSGMAMWCGW
jgi:hypothetical protein